MDLVTKLIYITMAITYWQFAPVQTGKTLRQLLDEEANEYQATESIMDSNPSLSKLFNESDEEYRALELMTGPKNNLYFYRNDNELVDPSRTFLYFCPPQQEWHAAITKKIEKTCLFLVETSTERKKVQCKNQVVPSLRMDNRKNCGTYNQGNEYYLYYELYYSTNYFKSSVNIEEYENVAAKIGLNEVRAFLTSALVYRFCFHHNTHETVYVSYTISSLSAKQPQVPMSFDTRLTETDDQLLFGLQQAPLCYKKEYQSFGADFGSNIGDDYLVEQMLVPENDIVENLARGSTKNYVNVSPQWKSLRDDWNNLNEYFRQRSMQGMQKVMCGTYGKFEHIRMGEPHVEQRQREMQSDQLSSSNTLNKSNLTLTAPLYWWKLVIMGTRKGILLIMPNYPKAAIFPHDKVEPVCEDVCKTYGWADVKKINPTIACCQPNAELMAKLLSSNINEIPYDIPLLAIAHSVDV